MFNLIIMVFELQLIELNYTLDQESQCGEDI